MVSNSHYDEENYEDRLIVYTPIHSIILLIMMVFGIFFFMFIFFWWSSAFIFLFKAVGFSYFESIMLALAIVLLSAVLSIINVPVYRIVREMEIPLIRYVHFFGIPYTIPVFIRRRKIMVIAINVGGAVIPIMLSLLFIFKIVTSPYVLNVLSSLIMTIIIVTLVSYVLARPVRGVGIVMPGFIPPMVSAFFSATLTHPIAYAVLVAYISGTLGVLLGADILHLIKDWEKLQAPIVSIGGAGTFDGIYLSGILAVLLLPLFII